MPEPTVENGVTIVPCGGAIAAFADATATPGSLAAAELAAAAGRALAARVGRELPVLYARQEHTRLTFVYAAERPLPPGPSLVGTCDALLTAETGVALQVRTADCLPVALAGGGAVAMVHAGWRGLAADILGGCVARFRTDLGVAPGELHAVVGVGIGPCHYAVGSDVIAGLGGHDAAAAVWRHDGAVDLAAFARGRLTALGVPPAGIAILPGCTACSPAFHSYRRDGAAAGRQWSAVVKVNQ